MFNYFSIHSSTSVKNRKIKDFIISQLSDSQGAKYSDEKIKGTMEIRYYSFIYFNSLAAVQRKYESLRRELLSDNKENKEAILKNESKKKKYRARRQRVCNDSSRVFPKEW